MKLDLRKIDKTNYNECLALRVADNQNRFVAPNIVSLVQAAYEEELHPLGVYINDKMVGFILYDYDEEIGGWSFSRFMIGEQYQNKGYGKIAVEEFLRYFHNKYPNEKLYTSAEIDNNVAISLYENHGFKKQNVFEYENDGIKYVEYRMLKETW